MSTTPKIFLTNASRYLNGELVGEWVEMPVDEDELDQIMMRIGARHQDNEEDIETFISDHEGFYPYKVKEGDSVESLNEISEFLNELDYCSRLEFEAICEVEPNWNNSVSIFRRGEYTYYSADNLYQLGMMIWDDLGNNNGIPEELQCYIDYEQFARDLCLDKVTGGYIEIH